MTTKERKFDGAFAEHINGFIRQKRALGYDYSEGAYILSRFENFCKKHFPDSTVLEREIGLKWAERRENEKGTCQLNRISVIREFGKYMNSIGVSAYVISPNLHKKSPPPKPYVFSNEELATLFQASDEYPYKSRSPVFHLIVSVIFRLMYCCGLRPVEVRRLRVEDVNLKTGQINILEAKRHKDRIVVMSDDVLELACKYNEQVALKYPNRSYFFYNHFNNGMYSSVHMQKNFRILLDMAGIEKRSSKNPRAYDLRHTFATHRLYEWLKEGEDIESCLAYLSEYMGHSNITDTAYYIHLVPEFFPQMAELGFQTQKSILPEVPA
jgi:integrase